jgi:S-DNA-T family DNA segregation ATPase FtsK/SpoIIIE
MAASGSQGRVLRSDTEGLRAWLAGQGGGRRVVVADDLAALPEPTADLLTAAAGPAGGVLLIMSGTAADVAGAFRGPAVALRRSRTALFLQPVAGDAELLGLRTPRTPLPPRPGAGWLISPGQVTRVQVARRRRPPVAP